MPQCFNLRPLKLKAPIERADGSLIFGLNVPCGKCENCIIRRRMEWCFRMEEEMKRSKTAYFVTLTYEPKKVKWDKYGNMILVKKHLQKFMKRLRINTERAKDITRENLYNGVNNKKDKIVFYGVGEYGEFFGRPHYHLIIFNASEKWIRKSWNKGIVHCVRATKETIAYVTKYLDKWKNKKQDWRKPKEFNIQSKGIGKKWADKMGDWYRRNLEINYMVNSRNIKVPLSRYYRLIMFDKETMERQTAIIHDEVERLKAKRILEIGVEKYNDELLSKQRYKRTVFKRNSSKRDM